MPFGKKFSMPGLNALMIDPKKNKRGRPASTPVNPFPPAKDGKSKGKKMGYFGKKVK